MNIIIKHVTTTYHLLLIKKYSRCYLTCITNLNKKNFNIFDNLRFTLTLIKYDKSYFFPLLLFF